MSSVKLAVRKGHNNVCLVRLDVWKGDNNYVFLSSSFWGYGWGWGCIFLFFNICQYTCSVHQVSVYMLIFIEGNYMKG